MPSRSIKIETGGAVFLAILGANIDPDFTFWIFRGVDVLFCAIAAVAVYLALLLCLDASEEVSRTVAAHRRGRPRQDRPAQRLKRPTRHVVRRPHHGAAA